MLKNRADINFTNEHGNTPLHYACFWGYEAIAEELIENGALAALANKDGDTPLDKGRGPILKHLKGIVYIMVTVFILFLIVLANNNKTKNKYFTDLALQSGQDLTKINFKDQSWLGLKTRSRKLVIMIF